jgi:Putative transposase/Transposase zinc-binding domain
MTTDHRCRPAAPACAEPTPPRWEVADIVRLYGDSYRQTHLVSPGQQRVLEAIAACRTAQLGGHVEQCPQCGFERYAYHSCRNRHCPKCQSFTKAQWVADRQAELLPVPYFHTVFTLPHALNTLVLGNQRLLLGLLFTAASQTLLQFGWQNLGGQLGGVMVLHTWDQLLNAHFHVHCLVPGGALADDGTRWVPTHPAFLFPVKALGAVFRAKFLEALAHAHTTAALTFSDTTAALATPQGFAHLLAHLYATAWVVYAKAPFAGPAQVVDYIGRYTHRVAITNTRLVDVRHGQVCFTYRNRRHGERLEEMTVDAHTFLHRFLLHVLPTGFVRLRHYGFLANRCKARTLSQCRHLLGQVSPPPTRQQQPVVQWIQHVAGIDLTQCPQCGARPLHRQAVPPASHRPRPRSPP